MSRQDIPDSAKSSDTPSHQVPGSGAAQPHAPQGPPASLPAQPEAGGETTPGTGAGQGSPAEPAGRREPLHPDDIGAGGEYLGSDPP